MSVTKKDVKDLLDDFGEDINWKKIEDPKSYYPTRLEYFAGKALQGLVIGRSQKDLQNSHGISVMAVSLAKALENVVDSEKD